ncbi:uncharacterized protein N7459_009018 [Penicillium hispanicum]|uniref:uncharacterized protein n=1 Tax=Penicillium hispanicum TaxID=1080232 RepID=UPI0025418654|nr:uncharacterized protein N7459_009018 [Penicillium hispanicum]KAJ5569588.1 hypothetical protein N7459_009018 [Penicillium hispanicum]
MPDMHAVFQHSASSPPKLDLASAHSQLFQVPSAATASSSLYSLSLSRKRPRRDTEKLSSKFETSSELRSASPLLQSDYHHSQTSGADDFHAPAELDYRPNRYRESFLPPSLDASLDSIGPEYHGTSRKRSRRDSILASPTTDGGSPTGNRVGWGRTVINAVGKVLDLCWSSAFRGFYAGGGQGYDMQAGPQAPFSPNWQPASISAEKDHIFRTPIPGQYPEEDIDGNWVVIPAEPTDPFVGNEDSGSPSLRARRVHQASSPRRRSAVMPRLGRRPAVPSVRPSTPTRNTALSSPRSRDGPASADMQRYAAQMRRKEREEDASIKRLNRQLQAMIREGKEALGTTVEVDDLEMDFD